MRVGVCDLFHVNYPKYQWVVDAGRRLGWEMLQLRTADQVASADCDFLIWSQLPPIATKDMRSLPKHCPWVAWVFDLLGHRIGDGLKDAMPWDLYDVVFCKNPSELENGYWMDQGAPLWPRVSISRPYDVLVPGIWRASRHEMVSYLTDAGYKVRVAGRGWNRTKFKTLGTKIRDNDSRILFQSAKVIVCDNYATVPCYWSDRVWMSMAAATPFVGISHQPNPSLGLRVCDNVKDMPMLIDEILGFWDECSDDAYSRAQRNRYDDKLLEIKHHLFTEVRQRPDRRLVEAS